MPAGSGSSSTIARMVSNGSPWSNGGRPSIAVYSVTPSENRSLGGPNLAPMARSGEMKCGDPSTMPGCVRLLSDGIRATPKSVSTHRPSALISTFAGFTSRCSTPAA